MKKYVCLVQQNGEGCDYTIACGKNFLIVEAEDRATAFEKIVKQLYFQEYLTGEADPSYYSPGGEKELIVWKMFEVSKEYDLLPELHGWFDTFNANKEVETNRRKDIEDRAKYEELKRRFG